MATHSSVLAWRIPGTGEPGGLPSMGVAQSRTRLKWLSSSSRISKHLDSTLKAGITLPTKVHLVKAMVFPVVMYGCWELDYEESWVLKNWYFWTVVLEKTLESPLDCKEIQPVHPKGDQFWVFIGRTDNEAETPIIWPPDMKNWLLENDPDAGKDWRQDKRGWERMVGWHHWFNGHEFKQALGVGDGQRSLACCSPRGHKDLDMTEWLNWTKGGYLNSAFLTCLG